MESYQLSRGNGRTRISIAAYPMGSDLVVRIYNDNAHIGAVAVGEYCHEERRASTSVITRTGHKDDVLAQEAAHAISKATRRPACVIAGVHLDRITGSEIEQILENSRALVQELIASLLSQ